MKGKKVSQLGGQNHSFLEQYKQVYSMYSHATRLIKEDNLDSAELILQEIFRDNEALQIPIEIYKTYILLLLTNKKEKQARLFLSNAPDDIKYAGEMLQIQQKYNLTIQEKTRSNRIDIRKMSYGLIGLLLLGMLVVGIFNFDRLKGPDQADSKVSELEKQIKNLEDKNKTMEMQVNEATKKLTEVSKAKKEDSEEVSVEHQSNLDSSNSLKPIKVVKQAVEAYEKGFEQFKLKNYRQAVEEFKINYTLDSTNYSSDDSLYYLILTEQKINKKANVKPYITEFVNQNTEFFKESPYLDDVLLMQAESLLKEHKQKEAEEILNKIVTKYPKEWTANKAVRILNGFKK